MFDINEFNENLDFRRMIEGEKKFCEEISQPNFKMSIIQKQCYGKILLK